MHNNTRQLFIGFPLFRDLAATTVITASASDLTAEVVRSDIGAHQRRHRDLDYSPQLRLLRLLLLFTHSGIRATAIAGYRSPTDAPNRPVPVVARAQR